MRRTLAATISVTGGERPGQQGSRGPCVDYDGLDRSSSASPCRTRERAAGVSRTRPSTVSDALAQKLASETRASSRALDGMPPATQSQWLPLVGHARLPSAKSQNGTEDSRVIFESLTTDRPGFLTRLRRLFAGVKRQATSLCFPQTRRGRVRGSAPMEQARGEGAEHDEHGNRDDERLGGVRSRREREVRGRGEVGGG